ncbi:hypothetical protein Efla_003567 [Eimeria flavescens]
MQPLRRNGARGEACYEQKEQQHEQREDASTQPQQQRQLRLHGLQAAASRQPSQQQLPLKEPLLALYRRLQAKAKRTSCGTRRAERFAWLYWRRLMLGRLQPGSRSLASPLCPSVITTCSNLLLPAEATLLRAAVLCKTARSKRRVAVDFRGKQQEASDLLLKQMREDRLLELLYLEKV